MVTSFSTLPIVDLSVLSHSGLSTEDLQDLSQRLFDVFATTGFAYLINAPLSFGHDEVLRLASDFFQIDEREKLGLAKRTFVGHNKNTYRGYFPTQAGQSDNLKEGFEVGPPRTPRQTGLDCRRPFNLTEPNVWPAEASFVNGRLRLEKLHQELQRLSATLLSLLAIALGKSSDHFSSYLTDSLSTLRLLHYPPQVERQTSAPRDDPYLCCTPHTDSGILTLLHQDPTGGLEVQNSQGEWIAAPYISGSFVVNVGDLMARVSEGRFVATMHRVRSPSGSVASPSRHIGMGRFSVPFFFEPGEDCMVSSVDGGESIIYGDHVRRKMATFVEYDIPEPRVDAGNHERIAVQAS